MKILWILLILFSYTLFSSEIVIHEVTRVLPDGKKRTYRSEYPFQKSSKHIKFYRKHFKQANSLIPYPFTLLTDTMVHKNGELIYKSRYQTLDMGIRKTPDSNHAASKHVVFSGDSNMFGVGSEDHQTLPNQFEMNYPIGRRFLI